jgi:preprotein translocase subunit YajC
MLNTILLQAAGSAGGSSWMTTLIFFGLFFAIIYFTMIAPQQKKQKKINAFRDSLKNGDKVMTAGGIYGRIREVKDNTVILEIADGVRIKIDKNSIYQSMQDVVETGGDVKK